MKQLMIIGGGASGLIASIYARKQGHEVIILERNPICGKKILVTGNGRCNYWNEDQKIEHYHSSTPKFLEDIITETNQKEILSFFDSIGIIPKIKNGYYYPNSNQATSIRNALEIEAKRLGVKIYSSYCVEKVEQRQQKFIIDTNQGMLEADYLLIATGSKACPKTGSDGIGYQLAKSFGHKIEPILPSLVQLRGEGTYLKKWDGVRCEVIVSLLENDKLIKKETGEIQLTDYGVSGICIFNLSGLVARGLFHHKKEIIRINFVPDLMIQDIPTMIAWLNDRNKKVKERTLEELLEGILNYKLVSVLLQQAKIKEKSLWNQLINCEKEKLASLLIDFPLMITGTNSFDRAQICSGGVSLTEINPASMESQLVPGLFFAGEILDVDGDCGGYNLTFAWISGMLAGKNIGGSDDKN